MWTGTAAQRAQRGKRLQVQAAIPQPRLLITVVVASYIVSGLIFTPCQAGVLLYPTKNKMKVMFMSPLI